MGRNRLGYVPALDGIRGVAILAVLAFHFFGVRGGLYGVDLFFVLSGFLITTLLLEEQSLNGRISLRGFYVRRARRLLPALIALLTVVGLIGSLTFPPGRLAAMIAASLFYCLNVLGAFGHHDVFRQSPVNHLWSLSQEEQFYFVWPAVLCLAFRRVRESQLLIPLLAVFIALVVWRAGLVAGGAGADRIYYGPDTHADGLVLGCAAAVARRRGVRSPTWLAATALVLLLAACVGGTVSSGWNTIELPLVNLAAAAVVLGATTGSRIARPLMISPLPWLGAISYSLYLWHEFARWFIPGSNPGGEIILTIPLALGSYYLIERRFRHPRPNRNRELVPRLAD